MGKRAVFLKKDLFSRKKALFYKKTSVKWSFLKKGSVKRPFFQKGRQKSDGFFGSKKRAFFGFQKRPFFRKKPFLFLCGLAGRSVHENDIYLE